MNKRLKMDGLAEIEIIRGGEHERRRPLRFKVDGAGEIFFGPHVEDVFIDAPRASVMVGFGNEAVMVAPVYIETETLSLEVDRLVAEFPSRDRQAEGAGLNFVRLIASTEPSKRVSTRPITRGNGSLQVTWDGSEVYPWNDFSVNKERGIEEGSAEALRRLRTILLLFRSHGKNQLAKYRGAIDHNRRTKGVGHLVRDQLLEEGVLSISGPMYYLDSTRLAEVTGLNFGDLRTGMVKDKTVQFVQRALARNM